MDNLPESFAGEAKRLLEEYTGQPLGKDKALAPIGDIKLTERNDRLTVRIDAYWESVHEQPIGQHIIAAMSLGTMGIEPYIRKFKATAIPKSLTFGDIDRENVGYILITNIEGTRLLQNPTEEERKDINSRIAVIDGFEIHPNGMPFLGRASSSTPLMVRCLHKEAILQVCLFPR